jgi:DNA-binding NtrC family response regulator
VSEPSRSTPAQAGRRLLIVDDEQGIRKLLSMAFTLAGYQVRVAESGIEAAAICASERFDVLLSDVRMPGMNGHELVQLVSTHDRDIRCVLMSGYDDTQCHGCGLTSQQCTLLSKPFSPAMAVSLVNQVLEAGGV